MGRDIVEIKTSSFPLHKLFYSWPFPTRYCYITWPCCRWYGTTYFISDAMRVAWHLRMGIELPADQKYGVLVLWLVRKARSSLLAMYRYTLMSDSIMYFATSSCAWPNLTTDPLFTYWVCTIHCVSESRFWRRRVAGEV